MAIGKPSAVAGLMGPEWARREAGQGTRGGTGQGWPRDSHVDLQRWLEQGAIVRPQV